MRDGYPWPSSRPVITMIHWTGSIRMPYLMRFSSSRRTPPIVNSKKPQLTRPVKLSKPELHENRESRGRWHLWRIFYLFIAYKIIFIFEICHLKIHFRRMNLRLIRLGSSLFVLFFCDFLGSSYTFGAPVSQFVAGLIVFRHFPFWCMTIWEGKLSVTNLL